MSDTFASVWDAAGDDAEAEQGLRALTSARIQVAPVWGFLAAAQTREEFGHRMALVEDQVRTAATERGVSFEVLATSLADDFHVLEAERTGPKVPGVSATSGYDPHITGPTCSTPGCTRKAKDPSNYDPHKCSSCANADAQGQWGKTASYYVKDGDKEVGGPYDSKADAQDAIDGGDVSGDNLTVSQGGDDSGDDGDDSDTDGDDSDSDEDADQAEGAPDSGDDEDDDKGSNPFAKKESSLAFPVIRMEAASVVHQPGETVFVDHFMGHDEHEGRKGVWATVVKSPGQHPYADRAESHLLKPMAPGGTHFFHHFGSVQRTASSWWDGPEGQAHKQRIDNARRAEFKSGVGSYDKPPEPSYGWKPHRLYDSIPSALNHLAGGSFAGSDYSPQEHRDMARGHAANLSGYNHCPSCDHVYSTDHPDHQTVGMKDTCPNCGDTDHHEGVADLLSEHGHYDQHHERTTYDDPGPDYHGMDGDNYGDPYGRHDQRHEGSQNAGEHTKGHVYDGKDYCKKCGADKPEPGEWTPKCSDVNKSFGSRKTALPDGVDPLQWIVETVPGGEGQAEAVAEHEGRTATIVERFRALRTEFATE